MTQKTKQKMTQAEKDAREKALKNESIEARTKRVLNPRIKKLLKQFDMLVSSANSSRYRFTEEQSEAINDALTERFSALQSAFSKTTKKEIKDIL